MFEDRTQAGQLLAKKLIKYKNDKAVLIAVPRGGVPVAYPAAIELGLPLDVALIKKIGHPDHKEYAIGAASLSDYFVMPQYKVEAGYIEGELVSIRHRLREMQREFIGIAPAQKIAGKTAIIIDDGMATGNTILATVKLIRRDLPGKIVIGVPVASSNSVEKLQGEVDEVVTVLLPKQFLSVGEFYQNFEQVSDMQVISYLKRLSGLSESSAANAERDE